MRDSVVRELLIHKEFIPILSTLPDAVNQTQPTKPESMIRNNVKQAYFNPAATMPYSLRLKDFEMAMQDIDDFFYDINRGLVQRGLLRLDDMLRPAIMSGLLSDMLTASISKHSRALTVNLYHNGHPDLVVNGVYAGNRIKAGEQGVEIKTTRKSGGAVDTRGARNQWMCVFVYNVECATEPARKRGPMTFTEIYLARIIHEGSAASADTRLRRAVSPFSPSTYCTSMPQDFTAPSARLASRLRAFATSLHE